MADTRMRTWVNHYVQHGYWRQLQRHCQDELNKKGNDPINVFWKGFGECMEGNPSEATREYEVIAKQRDTILAASAAMVHAHQRMARVDEEAVNEWSARYSSEEGHASEQAYSVASLFFTHTGQSERAIACAEQAISLNSRTAEPYSMLGWALLATGIPSQMNQCIEMFDKAIGMTSGNDVDAMMGKARYFELNSQYQEALDTLNDIIANHSWFTPALSTKAMVLVKIGDWEQAVDLCRQYDARGDIDATRIDILYQLVQQCNYDEAAQLLDDLLRMLERSEPANGALYLQVVQPVVRLSGRSTQVLNASLQYVEKALQLEPNNSQFSTEHGLIHIMLNDLQTAMASYRAAFKVDQLNMEALNGIIHCQILQGNVEDAQQQLEFLSDIETTVGKTSMAVYLNALLLRRRKGTKSNKKCLQLLIEAMTLHVKDLKTMAHDHYYYYRFDADFMVSIATQLLSFCGSEPADPSDPPHPVLKRATSLLKLIVKHLPGNIQGQHLLAKAHYLANRMDEAESAANTCFRLKSDFSEAHLLRTQILLHQNQYRAASEALSMALSHNFEVRESPLYHLITAKVNQKVGNMDEALQVLEAGMKLPGVTDPGSSRAQASVYGDVPLHLRCSLYLELGEVYARSGRNHEAAKALQDALNEFQGTSEHVRVLIANAKFAVLRGAIESALETLDSITHKMPHYMKAKTEMAEIYLQHRKNRKAYVRCYENMAEVNPSTHTYILLGDANMRIQDPEAAVAAYESALELDPKDAALASKIGRALVSTHDYGKAIEYYEAAVQADPRKFALRYDLAVLYKRLKQYSKSTYVLNAALKDESKDGDDVQTFIWDVKFLRLLSQVHQGEKLIDAAIEDLGTARSTQQTVINMIKGEQKELVSAQNEVLSDICFDLAEFHRSKRSYENAFTYYNDALRHNRANSKAMMAVAQLHLGRGELDQSRDHCVHLLRMEPSNEEALMMMADLMFKMGKISEATHSFETLLSNKPTHYTALVRLIDLLRRAGNLKAANKYLEGAEASSPKAKFEAGYHYAHGLYLMHCNNLQEALLELNAARRDATWGEDAIYHMVKIFLSMDKLSHDAFENASGSSSGGSSSGSGSGNVSSSAESIKSAQRLIQELPRKDEVMKYRVLPAYVLMRNGTKDNFEKALEMLIPLSNEDDSLVVPLAMATAYIGMGSAQKAKNLLRNINNQHTYNHEDADEYERLYLMLSDVYVQNGKYDLAAGFLRKIEGINRSSVKCQEYLGLIMEKEGAYADAAAYYDRAWEMSNENNPEVGYRLAFNLLKAKRYVEAIDVCHKVLKRYPRYPQIDSRILNKARENLRVPSDKK